MKIKPTIQDATEIMLAVCEKVPVETVPPDGAYGRILARDVYAAVDVPAFDRSAFDGYVFRASDTENASRDNPAVLAILEEVPAGHVPTHAVASGTAVKILTGAPIPDGADAVTKYEETDYTSGEVKIFKRFSSGDNIIFAGEDVAAGELLARDGCVLDGAAVALLAAQSVLDIPVYRRPRVGIIATGTELVDVGETLSYGQIYETNRFTLAGACVKLGAEPVYLGRAGDTVEAIAELITNALDRCDILLSTGGVSAGDYDLTPAALERAGAEILVRNVRMKPGGSCAFGVYGGKPVYCLSGSPAAALMSFYAVTAPVVRKLAGHAEYRTQRFTVKLENDFPKGNSSERLLRGKINIVNGEAYFYAVEQGNTVLRTFMESDAIAVLPPSNTGLAVGTPVEVFII